MLYSTASQALEFPVMILAGAAMAGASLLFMLLRRVICAGFWLSLVADSLLGIIWAAIFCTAIYITSLGSLRLYHIAATAIGAVLFNFAMGTPIRRACGGICRIVRRAFDHVAGNRLIQAIFK